MVQQKRANPIKFVGNYKIMELSRDLVYREQKDRCRAWGR